MPSSSINKPILMNCLGSILKELIANTVWQFLLNCFCYKIGILKCHIILRFICCIGWIISIPREDYFLQLVFEIIVFHVFSNISRIKQIWKSARVTIQDDVTWFHQCLQILLFCLIQSLWELHNIHLQWNECIVYVWQWKLVILKVLDESIK